MDWNTGKMVPVQETPELERGTKLLYYVGQPSNITRTYAVLDGKQRTMVLIPAFIPEKDNVLLAFIATPIVLPVLALSPDGISADTIFAPD